ncbi:MAG: hypothetical protein CMH64_03000 [Nanoarchaeota archaeon]|nr:hypothetical protein [Nanoarchaeota archaeon]
MDSFNKKQAVNETTINEHDLQNEWIIQPLVFLETSLGLTELIHQRDTLKSKKITEITKEILKSGSKLTDASLKRALEGDQELIDLDLEVGKFKAFVSALMQKKSSLENLVTLLINGLNAEPKTPEEKTAMKESILRGLKNGKEKD